MAKVRTNSKSLFILFITGISTAGKTTLFESLKEDKRLIDISFHDIDENGVPPVGRSAWRKYRVEELLFNAKNEFDEGVSTIICGVVFPHEVIESKYYHESYNVHFLVIEIPFPLFIKRMKVRFNNYLKNNEFNEDLHVDGHAAMARGERAIDSLLKKSIANQVNGHVIKAGSLDKKQVYSKTIDIIEKISPSNG